MNNLLTRLPKYLRRFGLVDGLRLGFEIERRQPVDRTRRNAYRVPRLGAPVNLRRTVADHSIFWQCLVMEQYDIDRFPHSRRLDEAYHAEVMAGRSPVIVDCGANVGLSVLWFARRFPKATIVAVEPDEQNFEMLRANTLHLGDQVRCVCGGVWSERATLKIENPDSGSAAFRVRPVHAGEEGSITAYSVADLRSRGGNGLLLIVKIDIEGSQAALFDANVDWVGEAHLITLELDDWLMPWAGTSRSFFACLSRYPFEYLLGGESVFCFRDQLAPEMPAIAEPRDPAAR